MADILLSVTGAWTGPGPSYFRVVAELWDYGDTGTGRKLRLRRWVQVNDSGNFGGTSVSIGWGANVTLYGPGTYYGLNETGDYEIKYGEAFATPSEYVFARYTSWQGTVYDSRTSVFYAVPKPTYAVSYNANGGTGAPAAQTKTYGKDLTLSKTIPTRTGYTFKNWNTKSDGTGTSYASGATYTANASITLYAIWKINTYAVTYNGNGGTGAPAGQTKTYGVSLTLSKVVPVRPGYKFLGWSTSKTAVSPAYAALILYAVWKRSGAMCLRQDGQTRKGRPWLCKNGEKRSGIPWIKENGMWRKGGA